MASLAEGRLKIEPDDDQARFALGASQFLGSVEGLGRAFYRYGLKSGEYNKRLAGLAGLPILRLPLPENLNPETLPTPPLKKGWGHWVPLATHIALLFSPIRKFEADLITSVSMKVETRLAHKQTSKLVRMRSRITAPSKRCSENGNANSAAQ